MKIRIISTVVVSILILSACVTSTPKINYPNPESYLIGKNIETVVGVYGNPRKSNIVGATLFISYSGFDQANYLCFLELQADNETKKIKKVEVASDANRGAYPSDVRQECNRVFYRPQLAK